MFVKNRKMDALILYSLLIIVCVSSVSVQDQFPIINNDQNLRKDDQLMENSHDPPIDIHDQLQSLSFVNAEQSADDDPPHNSWSALVPGTPGTDYPNFNKIPETSFSCADKTPGGYYADIETGCQVFHICNIGGFKSSFLCPEGSIFNQKHFVCDWWYGFHCNEAPSLYPDNQSKDDESNNNPSESSDTPTSESIDNYEPIEFRNNLPKDLAFASIGEDETVYTQKILPNDNQRDPLIDEQRNVAGHHNEKLDRKLRRNYGTDSTEVTMEREYSSNGQEFIPRGFSFNRETMGNAHRRWTQIPKQAPPLDGTGFKEAIQNSTEEEIRYVPAL